MLLAVHLLLDRDEVARGLHIGQALVEVGEGGGATREGL
jgi:hypothetical protein